MNAAKERGRQACLACRERKIRCSGPMGGDADPTCLRCRDLKLHCIWRDRAKRGTSSRVDHRSRQQSQYSSSREHAEAESSSSPASPRDVTPQPISRNGGVPVLSRLQMLLNQQMEVRHLVRIYFRTVHYYGFLSFIHEPSFLRLLERGHTPRNLTAVMMACALRFAGDATPATLAKADELYDEAYQRFLPQMYQRYGAVDLMTTMLARIFEHARGRFSASWMMVGNAVRMMQYLSLHTFDTSYPENPSVPLSPLLQREALRRLAWGVFYADCMVDAGLYGVHTVHENSLHIRLPTSDKVFLLGDLHAKPTLEEPKHDVDQLKLPSQSADPHVIGGISSHLVQTMAMRRRILHFLSSAKWSTLAPNEMQSQLDRIQEQLTALVGELPKDLAYGEGNLFVHAERRTAFVLLHVLRHNCFLMLYAARLDLYKQEASSLPRSSMQNHSDRVEACLQQRIRHAIPTAHIIQDALRLDVNCDPYVGSLGYAALEVIILDPVRLRQLKPHSDMDPHSPAFNSALTVILRLLRQLAPIEAGIANLRVEACRRLLRHGFDDLIIQSDRNALLSLIPSPGVRDEEEYDFRSFHWHRYEPRLRKKDTSEARNSRPEPVQQATAEELLDPTSFSVLPSRTGSPILGSSDAAVVAVSASVSAVSLPVNQNLSQPTQTLGLSFAPGAVQHDQQLAVGSGQSPDDNTALPAWLDFLAFDQADEYDAPAPLNFTGHVAGQWAALDQNSWADEMIGLQVPAANQGSEWEGVLGQTAPVEQTELPYWPFRF